MLCIVRGWICNLTVTTELHSSQPGFISYRSTRSFYAPSGLKKKWRKVKRIKRQVEKKWKERKERRMQMILGANIYANNAGPVTIEPSLAAPCTREKLLKTITASVTKGPSWSDTLFRMSYTYSSTAFFASAFLFSSRSTRCISICNQTDCLSRDPLVSFYYHYHRSPTTYKNGK